MSKKKLYEYEFTVTEVIDYVVKVQAKNLAKATDLAREYILCGDNAMWQVDTYIDRWECIYNEEELENEKE